MRSIDPVNSVIRRVEIAYNAPGPRELVQDIEDQLRITDTRLASEHIHDVAPRSPQPLIDPRLRHQPIRISRFEVLGGQLTSTGALPTLFASLGCLAVSRRTPQLRTRATLHTPHATPAAPASVALDCAFCAASIPLSDVLALFSSRDRAQCTVELLAALAVKHAEECTGRRGVESLKEDDAQVPVTEGCTKVIEGKH